MEGNLEHLEWWKSNINGKYLAKYGRLCPVEFFATYLMAVSKNYNTD